MRTFPGENLCASSVRYTPCAGLLNLPAIRIELKTFMFEGESVNTAIRLDHITLPANALEDLAGQTLVFPVNPQPGYIDGSIYIGSCHHTVDVDGIDFGRIEDTRIALVIRGVLHIDPYLADYAATRFVLAVSLELPLDEARRRALVEEAIAATQATQSKHIGRVMGYLSKISACADQMQALREVVSERLNQ